MQGQHDVIQGSVVRIAVCVHHIQLAPEIVPKMTSAAGLQPEQNTQLIERSAFYCSKGTKATLS